MISKICKYDKCGKIFFTEKWRNKKYCSHKCSTDNNIGKSSPPLKESLIKKYGEGKGIRIFDETREKIKNWRIGYLKIEENRLKCASYGEKNGSYGIKLIDQFINKYGEEIGKQNYVEFGKSISRSLKGRKITDETKSKIRNSKIERIRSLKNDINPFYNPIACKFIDEYGNKNGYNFQHAENGGEIKLPIGFFLDGYDSDKNVVIEYYEKHHYDILGNLKEKEINREIEIINYLNCILIRVNAFNINEVKIEKI